MGRHLYLTVRIHLGVRHCWLCRYFNLRFNLEILIHTAVEVIIGYKPGI